MTHSRLLLILALWPVAAAHATTVSFTSADSGTQHTLYNSLSFGGGAVTATGYFWDQSGAPPVPANWATAAVRFSSAGDYANGFGTGVGVTNTTTNSQVQSALQEFILLDFGGGTTTVSSLTLYIETTSSASKYFTYAWLPSAPTAGSGTPDPTGGSPFYTWDTGASYPSPSPAFSSAGDYTFNFSAYGSGRYLLLGSTDLATFGSDFRVNSVTFTKVPEAASTLALLGAAVGSLGLWARRRRR
jgi:hypothetical protein